MRVFFVVTIVVLLSHFAVEVSVLEYIALVAGTAIACAQDIGEIRRIGT